MFLRFWMAPTLRMTFSRGGAPAGRQAAACHDAPRGPCAGSTPSSDTTWLAGELGDRDDGIGARGGVARLCGEARAELRAWSIRRSSRTGRGRWRRRGAAGCAAGAGSVRGRDRRRADRAARPAGAGAHCAAGLAARAQVAMRPVAEIEARLRDARAARPVQDFARVEADAGELIADAVGGVERDVCRFDKRSTRYRIVSSSGRAWCGRCRAGAPPCRVRPWWRPARWPMACRSLSGQGDHRRFRRHGEVGQRAGRRIGATAPDSCPGRRRL